MEPVKEAGKNAAGACPQLVSSFSPAARPNEYVYNEYDNDDYKVFPPPGPGTVIDPLIGTGTGTSTTHGYTILPTAMMRNHSDGNSLFYNDPFLHFGATGQHAWLRAFGAGKVSYGYDHAKDQTSPPPANGTTAYGYNHGKDRASHPPVNGMAARPEPDQYVYGDYGEDDYKIFPPPGPGTVIDPTVASHTYTIEMLYTMRA